MSPNQVVCPQCGNTMLVTTAAETGGLCVPCASGTRSTLGVAKKRYEAFLERTKTSRASGPRGTDRTVGTSRTSGTHRTSRADSASSASRTSNASHTSSASSKPCATGTCRRNRKAHISTATITSARWVGREKPAAKL